MSKFKDNNATKNKGGNIYDRIFRENAQSIFIPLIEMQLGITIQEYKPLQEKIAKTLEREVDFLYQITTEDKKVFLLHIEFQTKNDPEMLHRMQEYHGIIVRKYKLAIRHIVIYLGKGKSTMEQELSKELIFDHFKTINIYEIDTKKLLSHQVPEVVLLALLSKHNEEQSETIIRLILERLKQLSKTNKLESHYINQLLILARLRNFKEETIQIIRDMPITIDIKKDYLYQQGIEQGVENSILGFYDIGITIKQIAKALNITQKRVKEVLRRYNKIV